MKKILTSILLAVALFAALPVQAQTSLTQTTLSAAINNSQTQFSVASATNIEVGGWLYIDHELMQVTAVSGTRVSVKRNGAQGSNINSHGNAANVFVATAAQAAQTFLPSEAAQRAGSCTPSNYQYLPIIDVKTGDVIFCEYQAANDTYRVWRVINIQGYNGAGSYRTSWLWP